MTKLPKTTTPTLNNSGNRGFGCAIFGTESLVCYSPRSVALAYLKYLLTRQFGVWMSFASARSFWFRVASTPLSRCHSPFGNSVLNVGFLRTKKQVRRVTARRIIAAMADKQLARINAKMKAVSYAMGRAALIVVLKTAVAKMNYYRSLPRPTGIRRSGLHQRPKPFRFMTDSAFCLTFPRTILRRVNLMSRPRINLKRVCTNLAGICYVRLSHDLNLEDRLGLWSGSLGILVSIEPFLFYHTIYQMVRCQ